MLNKQPKIKYTPLQVMDLEFIARAIYSFPDSNQAKERPNFYTRSRVLIQNGHMVQALLRSASLMVLV